MHSGPSSKIRRGQLISPTFWQGRSVLITGHTGFKGSWLALWLTQLGAEVHGYALSPLSSPNLYESALLEQNIHSTINDIRDASALNECVKSAEPEIIFHLAAQPIVRESFKHPAATMEVNVMGTVNLLEAARTSDSVKAVVVVTSDKCYENQEWLWGYRENDALGGHDPYSASKACAELVAQAWRLSFMSQTASEGHPCAIATARAGNVIGGGDWSQDRLIPDIVNAVEKGNAIQLRNPNAVRPWQHVLEPLAGYLMLAERMIDDSQSWSSAWNFGPPDHDARPVWWITEQLIKQFGKDTSWSSDDNQHPHEAQQLKLDCSKARELLGWSSGWELARCLEEIVEWHKAYSNGENMHEASVNTIKRYTQSLADMA